MLTPKFIKRSAGLSLVLILLVVFSGISPSPQPEMGSFIVKVSDSEAGAELIANYGGKVTS